MTEARLVAVLGAGRNGTTLISRLLDGSRELWIHPAEINYLCVWDDLARRGRVNQRTARNGRTDPLLGLGRRLRNDVLRRQYARQWEELSDLASRLVEPLQPAFDPDAALAARPDYGVAEFLPELIDAGRRAYAPDHPGAILAFKSIETPYVVDYERIFPHLRFVHLFREPAANYASAKRTWSYLKTYPFYEGGQDLLRRFLEARWLPHARIALERAAAAPDRHLLVRYEDLVREPQQTLARLCEWIGASAPYDPTLQTVFGGREFGRMPVSASKAGVETPKRVVANMAGAFAYDEIVSDRERELISLCTGRLAAGLGYAAESRPTGLARARLWLRWLPPDSSERLHVRSGLRYALELTKRRLWLTRRVLLGGFA